MEAVQLALKHGEAAQRRELARRLVPALLTLATDKHGSATAETLLQHADAENLKAAALLALEPAAAGTGVQRLCACSYGNYVLQTLIKLSAPEQKTFLESLVWRFEGPLDPFRLRAAWEASGRAAALFSAAILAVSASCARRTCSWLTTSCRSASLLASA